MGWKAWVLRHRAGSSVASCKTDPAEFERRFQLAAVESAYDDYTTRMQRLLAAGATLAVGVLALVCFVLWVAGSSAHAPSFPVEPVDDGVALGIFAILATVVGAVQLSARASVPMLSESANAARRRFLSAIAAMLVPVAIGLGVCVALPALAGAPYSLDLVRLILCPAGGVLVAVFAADAAMAHDDRDEFVQSMRSEQRRAELRARVLDLSLGTTREHPAVTAGWWIVVGVVPVSIGIVLGAVLGGTGFALLAGVALAMLCGAAAYAVVYDVYVNAARNTWSYLSPPTMLAFPVVLSVCATVVATGIGAEGIYIRSLAVRLLASILMFALPAALAVFLLGPSRGPRRIFRNIALRTSAGSLVRAIRNAERRPERARLNKLARASLWLSPVFPFGFVLGARAKAQIAAAGVDEAGHALARGRGIATAAQVVSSLALGIPVVLLVAIVVIDPVS